MNEYAATMRFPADTQAADGPPRNLLIIVSDEHDPRYLGASGASWRRGSTPKSRA